MTTDLTITDRKTVIHKGKKYTAKEAVDLWPWVAKYLNNER